MKKCFLLSLMIAAMFATAATAQPRPQGNAHIGMMPHQRTIQTTGTSVMEVAPDKVVLEIDLRGYAKPGTEGEKPTEVSIETVEANLYKELETLGVSKSNVVAKEIKPAPFNRFARDRRAFNQRPMMPAAHLDKPRPDSIRKLRKITPWILKNKEIKRYEITLGDFALVEQIKNAIDHRAVARTRVTEISNGKINEYRRQANVEALANATSDATALVEAAGGKLGEVMNIVVNPYRDKKDYADKRNGKIELRSSVTVTFAIE